MWMIPMVLLTVSLMAVGLRIAFVNGRVDETNARIKALEKRSFYNADL